MASTIQDHGTDHLMYAADTPSSDSGTPAHVLAVSLSDAFLLVTIVRMYNPLVSDAFQEAIIEM
ncbi:hypothetical protein PybrP1_001402 [[Pythium] brassicae (nom. inval.)]|nr:hypothetical protein PybrP1_001402 [[Pythium] brassicae (nom. inval.)]